MSSADYMPEVDILSECAERYPEVMVSLPVVERMAAYNARLEVDLRLSAEPPNEVLLRLHYAIIEWDCGRSVAMSELITDTAAYRAYRQM